MALPEPQVEVGSSERGGEGLLWADGWVSAVCCVKLTATASATISLPTPAALPAPATAPAAAPHPAAFYINLLFKKKKKYARKNEGEQKK